MESTIPWPFSLITSAYASHPTVRNLATSFPLPDITGKQHKYIAVYKQRLMSNIDGV